VSRNAFDDDIESGRRMLEQAASERRPEVLRQIAREFFRWHTVKGMAKADVVDALYLLGVEACVDDAVIQAALSDAVDNPFVPPAPRSAVLPAAPSGRDQKDARLVIRRASDIEPIPVRWLWENRVAIGKVTIIAGEPGLGKSQLTCAIAAAVTRGGQLPGSERAVHPGSVIILSAEDDGADTIRPRLDAADADASRVLIVSAVEDRDRQGRRSFSLQADLRLLEYQIESAGDVLLIVIDPLSSYLGKVDSHKNAELRAVLEPLGEMAARLGVAVVGVTHLNKAGNGSANNRFIGSIAFVAAARAAYVIARDPADKERRLFIPTKNNVGPEENGLAFRIGLIETGKGIHAPMVMWDGSVTITADEVLNTGSKRTDASPRRNDAEAFLKTILADGPLPVRRIESEAKEAGLSMATVRRAKEALGVIAAKKALDQGWTWELPPTETE
jgi:hypothetical protein